MDRIIESYLKYYSNRMCDECERTNRLIEHYQQEISSNGYGYINLAKFIEMGGSVNGLELIEEAKKYYYFLAELEEKGRLHEFEAFKYLNDEMFEQLSPLKIKVEPENHEPNQKWHLIVSYLGLNIFLNCRTSIHSVSCPELWMWMFEASDNVFDEEELDDIYNKAIEYRTNTISVNDWKSFLKPYRQKLHSVILNYYNKNIEGR